jgi:hypothetical protein
LSYFPAHGMADKHISIEFKRFDDFLRIRSKIASWKPDEWDSDRPQPR